MLCGMRRVGLSLLCFAREGEGYPSRRESSGCSSASASLCFDLPLISAGARGRYGGISVSVRNLHGENGIPITQIPHG